RFSPPKLSVDNFLPKLLADDLYSGHIPRPMTGDWLSSDRPPLQSGLALWNYAWTNGNRDLSYQVLGVIFQFTCLAGIFAYLEATRVSRTVTALVLAAAVFWGFAFLNSFFSWPKLLPTAFLFIVAAYLFTGRYTSARSDWRVGAMVGAAAALAMLCHGGSAFGILGIGLTALLLVRVPGSRFVAGAILAGALLYLPWSLYQKYYDPPGDRLLKWHLGGQISPRPEESLGHVLAENYGKLSRAQIVDYKRENFQALIGSEPFWHAPMLLLRGVVTGNHDQTAAAVVQLRWAAFLHWFFSIDVFSFAPFAFLVWILFVGRKSAEFSQACYLWLSTAVTLVIWCLLMFGPQGTWVYQGCYFTELAAVTGSILLLWSISPALAFCFTLAHVLWNVGIYIWFAPPQPAGYPGIAGPNNPVLAAAAVLFAAALLLALLKIGGVNSSARLLTLRRIQPLDSSQI
ncbi:MAG TPA: hypothetical protein VMD98_06255, partial [Bryocella sp.]|nr:hypothetical protein [Bryocella sp.]